MWIKNFLKSIRQKTVDNEIPNFGDNVTYTVTVTNDGIGDANNVVITDVLDKGLKFFKCNWKLYI